MDHFRKPEVEGNMARSAETGVPATGNHQFFPKTEESEAVRSRNRRVGTKRGETEGSMVSIRQRSVLTGMGIPGIHATE